MIEITALYLRASSEKQERRQTIENQQGEFEQDFQSGVLDRSNTLFIIDDGVRGKVPLGRRPGGAELLQLCKAGQAELPDGRVGKIVHVIVRNADRLARRMNVWGRCRGCPRTLRGGY